MRKKTNYLLLFFVFVSASSCLKYKEIKIQELQSVRILSMDENTADVEFTLKINNPNKWKITVNELQLDACVNKKYIGKVNYDKEIVLPKKSEQTYVLVLKTDMAQVKKLIPSLMFSNQAIVNLKGNVKVKARGFSKRIELDHDEKISRNAIKSLLMGRG